MKFFIIFQTVKRIKDGFFVNYIYHIKVLNLKVSCKYEMNNSNGSFLF